MSDPLFCLVDTAGCQLETSLVQRFSGCLATILACLQQIWLCLKIHDEISLAAKKSSDLRVALVMQSKSWFVVVAEWLIILKE